MDEQSGQDYHPGDELAQAERVWPFVSVIVPFFGTNTELLDRCIDGLLAQDYSSDKLEVIIVDNNVRPLLGDRYRSLSGSLSVIHEPQPGSYCARNRGISAARGEVTLSRTVTARRQETG